MARKQHDVRHDQRQAGEGREVGDQEVGVLEVRQREQVDGDRRDQQHRTYRIAVRRTGRDPSSEAEVDEDRRKQDGDVARVPPAVEHDGHQREPDCREATIALTEQEEADQRDRREPEQEDIGVEQHPSGRTKDGTHQWSRGYWLVPRARRSTQRPPDIRTYPSTWSLELRHA